MAERMSGDVHMIMVKATSTISIASGIVYLTPKQYFVRSHNLVGVDPKKGLYAVATPIFFKAGEVFGVQKLDRYLEMNTVKHVVPVAKNQ